MHETDLAQFDLDTQRPARRRWWRMLPPALLVPMAIAGLTFGYAYNNAGVQVDKEVTQPAPPPPPPRPNMFGRPTPPPPPPKPKTVIVTETVREPEYIVVLEATRGGLTLLDSGELKRTYSGAPPAGCPT